MDARQKGKTAVAPTLATINLQFDKTAASSTESDQLQDALIVALFVVSERLMIVKGKTTLGARLESRDANAGLGDMWNEMRLITNKSHGKQSVTASRSKDTSAYKPLLISKSGQEPLLPQGLLKVSSSPQENINANSNTESFSSSSSNGNIAAINLPAPSSREVSAILKKQSSCTSVHSFESVAASSAAGSNSIYLPSEILSLIFKCLKHSQKDLATIVLVSKFWNIVGTRLLYDAPQIGSMSSFQMFLNTLTNACNTFPGRQQLSSISGEPLYIVNGAMKPSIWSYHEFCNALYFLPSDDGSLYDKMPYNSEIINEVHSILFRILTHDRGIDLLAGHPLFLHLLNICPNLVSIREKSRLDTPSKLLSREGGSRNRRGGGGNSSSNSFRPLPDSNMSYSWVFSDFNLAQVLLATNRVRRLCRVFIGERLYQPPSVLKSDASVGADMKTLVATIQRISDSVLFLMELFEESQDNCVWDSFCRNPIQSKNVNTQNIKILEKAQAIVMVRCRNFLNALSSTLLLQVQYVTVSSQRLLDTYCLSKLRGMHERCCSLLNPIPSLLHILF